MSYEPRGAMVALMDVVRSTPSRLLTVEETAAALGCKPYPSTIGQYIAAAVQRGAMFRVCSRGEWLYAGQEITDEMLTASGRPPRDNSGLAVLPSPTYTAGERDRASADPRAPGPSGFVPKPMVAPRAGSEQPRPTRPPVHTPPPTPAPVDSGDTESGKRTTSAAQASGHEIPDAGATPEHRDAAAAGQERHPELPQQAAQTEGSGAVANAGDAQAASGGCARPEDEPEFDAALWLDGDLVIYGAAETEDGGILITKEQLVRVKRLIAWSTA